jgi:prepilin-type N-terminal cleavage/methylation domain-containing protein
MESRRGLSLIEVMVVIFTVGILAVVAVTIMRGRINSAKWSEANASAGSIRRALLNYVAEKGPGYDYSGLIGDLDNATIQAELGFSSNDLDGTYFNQADYSITADPSSCVV